VIEFINIATRVVFIASVAHSVLPPWDADAFQPFPRFVKFYKVLIYIIGFIAVNGRSTVYHSISIAEPGGVNESVANAAAPEKFATPPKI
jgi:hypothetical protein